MAARKRPSKSKEIDRRPIGLSIGGHRGLLSAHVIYDVSYVDGTRKIERGRSVHNQPGILPVGAPMPDDVRADLQPVLAAARILYDDLMNVCLSLDAPRKKRHAR